MVTVKQYIRQLIDKGKTQSQCECNLKLLEYFRYDRQKLKTQIAEVFEEYKEEQAEPEPDREYQERYEQSKQSPSRFVALRIPVELFNLIMKEGYGSNISFKIKKILTEHFEQKE